MRHPNNLVNASNKWREKWWMIKWREEGNARKQKNNAVFEVVYIVCVCHAL